MIDDDIDVSLPVETTGPDVGKVTKTTIVGTFQGLLDGLTVAKTEITTIQSQIAALAAAVAALTPGGGVPTTYTVNMTATSTPTVTMTRNVIVVSGGISTPATSKVGVFTTVTFNTTSALRGAVEFGPTLSYGTAVAEDFGTSTTSHTIVLESNADPLLSPHGLQTGQTYNLRALAGVGGAVVSPNITFVA